METTTITTKKKSLSYIKREDIQNVICAILLGIVVEPFSFCIILPYLAYAYMRKQKDCLYASIIISACALMKEVQWAFLYAIGFAFFFLVISILRMWDKNIYRYLSYVTTALSIPFAILFYGFTKEAFFAILITAVLTFELKKDTYWIHKKYQMDPMVYACIIFSVMMIVNALSEGLFFFPITTGFFLLLALVCDIKVLLTFIMMGFLFLPFEIVEWYFPLIWITLCIFRKEKMVAVLVLIGCYIAQPSFYNAVYAFMAGGFLLLYKEEYVPFLKPLKIEEEVENTSVTAQHLLRRQINNFSSIFDSLSAYYVQHNSMESEMLANMSGALKYCADEVKRISDKEPVKDKIMHALEGYQYDVSYFMMEEIKEGIMHLELDIKNIKKIEIKNTLLPLLEVLLHTSLSVRDSQHVRFTNGYYHIVLETSVPFEIDCFGSSLKNPYEESGDTFSIFTFRQSMICILSDGMGIGKKAGDSSRLITNIFQRMIVSGMSQISSIKCINKLIQSDAYATLDVLSFDQSQGKAYISKAAACPTYLFRGKELHRINGQSLPIGIVSQVEPDCYMVDIKDKDEYLMVSDGILEEEIETWLKNRTSEKAKESVKEFIEILKQQHRKDDSTLLYAKVQEV